MHACNTQLIGIELSLYIIDKVAHWLTVALIFFSWALLCINYFGPVRWEESGGICESKSAVNSEIFALAGRAFFS